MGEVKKKELWLLSLVWILWYKYTKLNTKKASLYLQPTQWFAGF